MSRYFVYTFDETNVRTAKSAAAVVRFVAEHGWTSYVVDLDAGTMKVADAIPLIDVEDGVRTYTNVTHKQPRCFSHLGRAPKGGMSRTYCGWLDLSTNCSVKLEKGLVKRVLLNGERAFVYRWDERRGCYMGACPVGYGALMRGLRARRYVILHSCCVSMPAEKAGGEAS